ncbi:hypothetical protein [Deinococcus xinjiangensis]|uniref:hypothetical protein n=1 Tax=Deinococcus xinjiangensis TaxID=457454 RepID=UPI00336535D7
MNASAYLQKVWCGIVELANSEQKQENAWQLGRWRLAAPKSAQVNHLAFQQA